MSTRDWQKANPEAHAARQREWRNKNIEKYRAWQRARYRRIMTGPAAVPKGDRLVVTRPCKLTRKELLRLLEEME